MKNGSITSAFDVEEKLRKSFEKIIQSMLEEEINEYLGREKYLQNSFFILENKKEEILLFIGKYGKVIYR